MHKKNLFVEKRFVCIDENSSVTREDRQICELSYDQLLFDPFYTYSVVDNKTLKCMKILGTKRVRHRIKLAAIQTFDKSDSIVTENHRFRSKSSVE